MDLQTQRELREYLWQFITEERGNRFLRLIQERTRHITVVLEDIFKSHNISACMRTCDCFGVQDVHLIENLYDFEVNKDVAVGSLQWLTLHRHRALEDNTAACFNDLRARGYRIVVTSPHEPDVELEDYDIRQKTALVFGSEHTGISDIARAQADEVLSIPIHGFTESFNISVACALALHHMTWKLRRTDLDWQLCDEEQQPLLLHWARNALPKYRDLLEQKFFDERGQQNV